MTESSADQTPEGMELLNAGVADNVIPSWKAALRIPVLVVTACVGRATPDAVDDAGAGLYLPKPFVNRTLVEAVRRTLRER